ncbi:uncharacterized protein [Mycetomoellerius zeteki]|uniref:uncharacterized protein n=1 Tax=Mycetomoellerius zeteki TaxID=64791 RepID=UPI00084E7430|nr:PREDICTED: uncharacterized protein LOC108726251 [Trachymyrmex zeteki]
MGLIILISWTNVPNLNFRLFYDKTRPQKENVRRKLEKAAEPASAIPDEIGVESVLSVIVHVVSYLAISRKVLFFYSSFATSHHRFNSTDGVIIIKFEGRVSDEATKWYGQKVIRRSTEEYIPEHYAPRTHTQKGLIAMMSIVPCHLRRNRDPAIRSSDIVPRHSAGE